MFHDPSRFDRPATARSRGAIWVISRSFSSEADGVSAYTRAIASTYADLGWVVSLFVRSSSGPQRTQSGGHNRIDVSAGWPLFVQIRMLSALFAAWFRGPLPAAIHACSWRAAIAALPFAVPLVVTVHGRELAAEGFSFRWMRFVLDRTTRIVAVSGAARALLLDRLPHLADRCVVAGGGMTMRRSTDRRAILSRGTGPTKILTAGRLLPRKNIASALFAVRAAISNGHALTYRIVGDGPDLARLQGLIDDLDLGQHVELLGAIDDSELSRLQEEADIFLHPQVALDHGTDIEGFGFHVANAMAQGLMCIVGREGGPAELVADGETGLVVDGRSREAVARALDGALRHPALRTAMGLRARQWVNGNLSWRRHAQICLSEVEPLAEPLRIGPMRIAA